MKQKEFEGKSIIIAVPNHFGLPQRFKENLEFLGFEVFVLQKSDAKVTICFKDKIIHGCKKLLWGNRNHKPLMKNKLTKADELTQLLSVQKADYALFIRPDLFDFEVIKRVKQIASKTIAYQWDGMNRYPLAKEYIGLFDDFYVFDKNDLALNHALKHTTNFYFDDITSQEAVQQNSVFFIGTYIKNRVPSLNNIITVLENNHLTPKVFLVSKHKNIQNAKFKIIEKGFSFKESALQMLQSGYLLDLHNTVHNGLSFRTFESVGYRKKLITDNVLVKTYDFYNPKNIFVIEGGDFTGFEDFIKTPYQPLKKEIREKYSFTNWIKQLLQI